LYDESDHPDMQDNLHDPLGMSSTGGGMGSSWGNPNAQINPYKVYSLDEAIRILQQALRNQGYTVVSPHFLRGPPLPTFPTETATTAATASLDKDSIDATSSSSLGDATMTTDTHNDGDAVGILSTPTVVLVRTRDWILAQAKQAKDRDANVQLANTLLMTIGAVSHISHCLYQNCQSDSETTSLESLHASNTTTALDAMADQLVAEQRYHKTHQSHSHDRHGHCQ
jgi:hypothetical protein